MRVVLILDVVVAVSFKIALCCGNERCLEVSIFKFVFGLFLSRIRLVFDASMIRWQSDDGSKFLDFDAAYSLRLESALLAGLKQFQIAEKNWLFDFSTMKQTNVLVR